MVIQHQKAVPPPFKFFKTKTQACNITPTNAPSQFTAQNAETPIHHISQTNEERLGRGESAVPLPLPQAEAHLRGRTVREAIPQPVDGESLRAALEDNALNPPIVTRTNATPVTSKSNDQIRKSFMGFENPRPQPTLTLPGKITRRTREAFQAAGPPGGGA